MNNLKEVKIRHYLNIQIFNRTSAKNNMYINKRNKESLVEYYEGIILAGAWSNPTKL